MVRMIDLNPFKKKKGDREPDQDRELRDNIEQIRRKVRQQEQGGSPQEQQAGRQQPAGRPEQRPPAPSEQPAPEQPAPRDAPEPPVRRRAESRQPAQREPGQRRHLPRGRDFREDRNVEAAEPEPRSEYGQPAGEESGRLPAPPQVKEIDLPEIEKGPLFITVKRFKEAMRTVSALQQFSRQMEADIGSLENTLDQDRETRERFQQLIDNVGDHRERIQTIIEP